MLKEFKKNGKTFTLKESLGEIEQWECNGDLFVVRKRNATENEIDDAYLSFCEKENEIVPQSGAVYCAKAHAWI